MSNLKYCVWRYLHLQKMVLCHTWGVQHKNSQPIRPAPGKSSHQTRGLQLNNCFWALLKLFVGRSYSYISTVCKYSHQHNKIENMVLFPEILQCNTPIPVSVCDILPLQIIKVSSQTMQTIQLTIWENIFIQRHIRKTKQKLQNGAYGWQYLTCLNNILIYVTRHFANMDTGCNMKCSNIPQNCYWTLLNLVVCTVCN